MLEMSFLDRTGRTVVGVGVYSLPHAARLVRLPLPTVESLVGPEPDETTLPRSWPVAITELDLGDDQRVVTFLGLMELYVAAKLRAKSVRWPTIRLAAYETSRVLKVRHPLASGLFRTDGKRVFLGLKPRVDESRTVLDLLQHQHVFEEILEQTLSEEIVVRNPDGSPKLWYPMGLRKRIVLDPDRRFGEPIDPKSGIPTSALAQAFRAEKEDANAAAYWFDVDRKAVVDAVEFEKWLDRK